MLSRRILNKRGLSPLIATILLVVFALIIGTAVMSWGKNYVQEIPDKEEVSTAVISPEEIDNPLKKLQIKYITGKVDLEDYLYFESILLKDMEADQP